MFILDLIDDAFLSSSRIVKTHKMESVSKRIFIFIYLLTFLIFLYFLLFSYKLQSKISFSQLFIQDEDYEQSMTFGFLIENNWTDKINIELFDSNNNPIFNNDTCDENLNLLTNDEVNLTQNRSFKCFINYKFKKSYTTNHQIKIHIKKNNSFNFNEFQGQRIALIIKFKEPIVNHSLDNPFDFPSKLQELIYFYDKDNVTAYRKYAKIIEYKTYSLFGLFDIKETIKSHYLEDYEDSSKTIEEYNDTMIGSFRICLSKKKDIFERRYKNILELMSTIGGFIPILNIVFNIILKIFVNSLDNLRLLNSIREKKNIQNNNVNIPKDFWNEPEHNIEQIDLTNISEFTDEDKKKFIFISMIKACKNNCNIKNIIIGFIIILPTIAIFILSCFCIIFLWIFLGLIALSIIILIIYMLCKKEGFCFCFIFTYNIIYIIIVVVWWSVNHCSFAFYIDNLWIWLLFIIIEVVIILFYLYCRVYKNYKNEDVNVFEIGEENKIFPFAISEYINSNINLDNLLENEI